MKISEVPNTQSWSWPMHNILKEYNRKYFSNEEAIAKPERQ